MRSADVITICRSHSEFSVRFDLTECCPTQSGHIFYDVAIIGIGIMGRDLTYIQT